MTGGYGLLVADLIGVAVFAASGASAASPSGSTCSASRFVGFVAALGGGILRDLVIDAVPPLAFADWRYAVTAVVASVAVFWLHPQLNRLRRDRRWCWTRPGWGCSPSPARSRRWTPACRRSAPA